MRSILPKYILHSGIHPITGQRITTVVSQAFFSLFNLLDVVFVEVIDKDLPPLLIIQQIWFLKIVDIRLGNSRMWKDFLNVIRRFIPCHTTPTPPESPILRGIWCEFSQQIKVRYKLCNSSRNILP